MPRPPAGSAATGPVLICLLSLRRQATSAVVYVRHLVPRLVDALDGRAVILADAVGLEAIGSIGIPVERHSVPDRRLAKLAALRVLLPRAAAPHGARAVFLPEGPHVGAPLDVPVVAAVHAHIQFSRPQGMGLGRRIYWTTFLRRAQARDAGRCAALIAPTMAFARELPRYLPLAEGRIVVVPHGVSPVFVPLEPHGGRRSPPRVLAVGSALPYKNIAGALRIFAAACEHLPHELRIAGVEAGALDDLATEAGIDGSVRRRVRALGLLGEDALAQEYRLASALLFPSRQESFGLPVAEAMACGTPVACSDLASLAEVSAGAAVLCDPEDETRFASELRNLLVDPARARSLVEAGLARARDLTWEESARRTADVLRSCA